MEPPGGMVDAFEYRDIMRAVFKISNETVDQVQARYKAKNKSDKPTKKGAAPAHKTASPAEIEKLRKLLARSKQTPPPPPK